MLPLVAIVAAIVESAMRLRSAELVHGLRSAALLSTEGQFPLEAATLYKEAPKSLLEFASEYSFLHIILGLSLPLQEIT